MSPTGPTGPGWLLLACLVVLVGVVMGLYTRSGSEIASHPYAKGGNRGDLGTDMHSAASGRVEIEPHLWPRRAGRRPRRGRT
jgi:hypothetical protein